MSKSFRAVMVSLQGGRSAMHFWPTYTAGKFIERSLLRFQADED
jgi:hypothetical protein